MTEVHAKYGKERKIGIVVEQQRFILVCVKREHTAVEDTLAVIDRTTNLNNNSFLTEI